VAEHDALPPGTRFGEFEILRVLGVGGFGIVYLTQDHSLERQVALKEYMPAALASRGVGAMITVPLFLGLSTSHFDADVGDPSMLGVVARVLAITIVPVALGMELRQRRPLLTASIHARVRRVSLTLFVLVVLGAIASEHDTVTDHIAEVAGAALGLNLAAMAVSFAIAKLARLGDRQSTAISLELGVHNAALAIAVGASLAPEVTIPAAVYSSFMLFTGGAFAWVMSRRNRDAAAVAAAAAARARPAET
jgi:BASS family bile acid:Na+ symporter